MKTIKIGDTYKDGQGRNVKIIFILKGDIPYPVIGVITENNGDQFTTSHTKEGQFDISDPNNISPNLILEEEIDWDSNPLVESRRSGARIRTTKSINEYIFEGVLINSHSRRPIGYFGDEWNKKAFILIKE